MISIIPLVPMSQTIPSGEAQRNGNSGFIHNPKPCTCNPCLSTCIFFAFYVFAMPNETEIDLSGFGSKIVFTYFKETDFLVIFHF